MGAWCWTYFSLGGCFSGCPVTFQNFRTLKNFAVIYLKFKRGENLGYFVQKDANGIANYEDPDQNHTAPRAV